MSDNEDPKDAELWRAVEKGDVNNVHELLEQGANPNYLVTKYTSIATEALMRSYIEIFKLLVQYGAKIHDDYDIFENIFDSKNIANPKELVSLIIEYDKKIDLLDIYPQLVCHRRESTESNIDLDILKLLLDKGLPVNEYLIYWNFGDDQDSFTPLQLAIYEGKEDFVFLLLEYGADVYKNTKLGNSCLWVAAYYGNESVIKLLVRKGLNINEKFLQGRTALHRACMEDEGYAIYALCKYGADVNILDDLGRPACTYITVFNENKELMVTEFAKLRFENQFLCPENLEFIQRNEHLQEKFQNCIEELRKMKNLRFYNGFSVYNIFKMHNQTRKLTFLMKNDDFVAAFNLCWNCESFKYYKEDVNDIFEDCLTKKNILVSEEEKLSVVFKDFLPALVLRKVAFFIHEHLFFYK